LKAAGPAPMSGDIYLVKKSPDEKTYNAGGSAPSVDGQFYPKNTRRRPGAVSGRPRLAAGEFAGRPRILLSNRLGVLS
jgi:hypothetical protein